MEEEEKVEEEKGNVESSSSTSCPQSSSMDQESEDAGLVRQIINNHLVSRVLLNIKTWYTITRTKKKLTRNQNTFMVI